VVTTTDLKPYLNARRDACNNPLHNKVSLATRSNHCELIQVSTHLSTDDLLSCHDKKYCNFVNSVDNAMKLSSVYVTSA